MSTPQLLIAALIARKDIARRSAGHGALFGAVFAAPTAQLSARGARIAAAVRTLAMLASDLAGTATWLARDANVTYTVAGVSAQSIFLSTD